jgi:NAD(P)H-dependent flavin oxidoreductase YrpB (nitropropane dioxygenase family)
MSISLHTPICDVLGIRVPIIQAPIGSACSAALIAEAANAGALGMLAGSWLDPERLRDKIRTIRALTSSPFGVNFVLAWPQDERVAVAIEEGVRIVSFFWGDVERYAPRVHRAGGLVLHSAGSVVEARRAVDQGADIVVAQGWEAGGHVRGDVALSVLVPAVCDAIAPRPVVAAGGVADGRGLVAALALGAEAVWMGTRFLAATEAQVDPMYHSHLIAADDTATVHTTLFDGGWPDAAHRVLRNSTVRAWEAAGCPIPPHRPGENEIVAFTADGHPIPRYSDIIPVADTTGDVEALAMYAGQSAALVRDVASTSEIVSKIVADAESVLRRLALLSGSAAQQGVAAGGAAPRS